MLKKLLSIGQWSITSAYNSVFPVAIAFWTRESVSSRNNAVESIKKIISPELSSTPVFLALEAPEFCFEFYQFAGEFTDYINRVVGRPVITTITHNDRTLTPNCFKAFPDCFAAVVIWDYDWNQFIHYSVLWINRWYISMGYIRNSPCKSFLTKDKSVWYKTSAWIGDCPEIL